MHTRIFGTLVFLLAAVGACSEGTTDPEAPGSGTSNHGSDSSDGSGDAGDAVRDSGHGGGDDSGDDGDGSTPDVVDGGGETVDTSACGKTPAWKQGFGAKATGGASGKVIYVTSLADSGPGTLRAALEASGSRTILFRTGGTITLQSPIVIKSGDVTVAGQSAPEDSGGITLRGSAFDGPTLKVAASNVILRHFRIRRGPGAANESNGDALLIGDPKVTIRKVLVDHMSLSWGTDEVINTWFDTADVTIQWAIVSEGLNKSTHEKGAHSKGVMFGGNGRLSLISSLMTHNVERNPLVTTDPAFPVELINNVIYAYAWAIMPTDSYGNEPRINIIGNEFIAGTNTKSVRYGVEPRIKASGTPRFYLKGNLGQHRTSDTLDERLVVHKDFWSMVEDKPFAGSGTVAPTSAAAARKAVLARAGARVPAFDTVDDRIVHQVKDKTGSVVDNPSEVGGWPQLAKGTPYADTDGDGIPDAHEKACATLEDYLDWRGYVP